MKFVSSEMPGVVLDVPQEVVELVARGASPHQFTLAGTPIPATPAAPSAEPASGVPSGEMAEAMEIERQETLKAILFTQVVKAHNRSCEIPHPGACHHEAELIVELTSLYMEACGEG